MAKFPDRTTAAKTDKVEIDLLKHHHIGKSQEHYEHIGTFLRAHAYDPAVKVRF